MGELITQVYAKANEREMDVLTELLEAPDTIKLIADTLAKVRKPIPAHAATGAIPGIQPRIKGDCTVCG